MDGRFELSRPRGGRAGHWLGEIAGGVYWLLRASGDAAEGCEVVLHHRIEGESLLGGVTGLLGDLFEQAGDFDQGGDAPREVGGGVDVGEEAADAVFDDFGGTAGGVGDGGHAAGHGLEEGIGESFMRGGHGEEVHGLIERGGLGLMALEMDAGGDGALPGVLVDVFALRAAIAENHELEPRVVFGEGFEGFDEKRVAFGGDEPADGADDEGVGREAAGLSCL